LNFKNSKPVKKTAREKLIELIGVPVEQGIVSAGGIKTAYLKAGKGKKVVLLHGAGAGAVTWYKTIGALSKHFQVIAPDIVGYGESDKPNAPYDRAYYSKWLLDFIEEQAITHFSLVGNSQGGAIAIQFALDNPNKIERLVLVDSAGLSKRVSFGALFGLFLLNLFPSKLALKWMEHYLFCNSKCVDNAYAEYTLHVNKMPGGNLAFLKGKGKAVRPFTPEELERIKTNVLIVWGEKDRFFPSSDARRACAFIPNCSLKVLPETGHLPFFEKPNEFNNLLIEFLQK
jgi:4,5:9,10-diseco-3-hydroxy-5,9,17-trioxoandrosta-1(10),2-diene-4-oate hydrolase